MTKRRMALWIRSGNKCSEDEEEEDGGSLRMRRMKELNERKNGASLENKTKE